MIESLLIKNFAIIDDLQIDFNNNMTVLTGETGAGKSIIIDAIGQLLGERTQLNFIKSGKESALIEGVFDISQNKIILKKLFELGFENDDKLVVSKSFQTDGKTTIKINYRNVSQAILKTIMPSLIDIHSQFETHSLFDEKNHINILDDYIGKKLFELHNEYLTKYHQYKAVLKDYNKAINEELSDEQLEYYKTKLEEIDELDLDSIDEKELEKEKLSLQNYEKINKKITSYQQFMNSSRGVLPNLDSALRELEFLSQYDEYKDAYEKIYDLYYNLIDLDDQIVSTFNDSNFDEYRLNEIQDLIYKLNRLKKKYGPSLESIKESREDLYNKIEAFKNRDIYINQLTNQLATLKQEAIDLSQMLTTLRKEYAEKFTKAIKKELSDLYLSKVEFVVSFDETPLNESGKDKISFMISTNVGQSLRPLSKVASGGELSRIMLAIKILSLQSNATSTIIFDEADTGVSGQVANSIGSKMKKIGLNKQVLCITHLAQVASFANHHYLIKKKSSNDNTTVIINELNYDDSIIELAKMISGEVVTNQSIEHAKTLKDKNIE